MGHRNDHQSVAVDTVDQTIREAGYEATSVTGLNFGARQWKRHRPSHCSVEFVKEPLADIFTLLIIPDDRIIQFLLSELQETYSHERRCFAITVS